MTNVWKCTLLSEYKGRWFWILVVMGVGGDQKQLWGTLTSSATRQSSGVGSNGSDQRRRFSGEARGTCVATRRGGTWRSEVSTVLKQISFWSPVPSLPMTLRCLHSLRHLSKTFKHHKCHKIILYSQNQVLVQLF